MESIAPPLLEYERTTHFPTRRGNLRFRVGADGGVYFQRNDKEPPAGAAWTAEFSAQPQSVVQGGVAALHALLDRHDFFAMESRYRNELSSDGSRESLAYHGPRGEKTVEVDRMTVPAFRTLLADLLVALGVQR